MRGVTTEDIRLMRIYKTITASLKNSSENTIEHRLIRNIEIAHKGLTFSKWKQSARNSKNYFMKGRRLK